MFHVKHPFARSAKPGALRRSRAPRAPAREQPCRWHGREAQLPAHAPGGRITAAQVARAGAQRPHAHAPAREGARRWEPERPQPGRPQGASSRRRRENGRAGWRSKSARSPLVPEIGGIAEVKRTSVREPPGSRQARVRGGFAASSRSGGRQAAGTESVGRFRGPEARGTPYISFATFWAKATGSSMGMPSTSSAWLYSKSA